MPETRALPIAAEHREFTVKAGGQAVPREHQLLSVSVTVAANRIASARLVYVDGAASTGQFPLSDGDLFTPGQSIEILAGAGRDSTSVFIGTVVRQGARVRESAASQLVVDCRHAAMKLSIGERSSDYYDQSDSEVITAVLDAAGQAIAQLSRRQAGAADAELQQGFQLVAAALTGTQTFKAVPPDRRAGHWLYLAYRGHDASTICRPVFFSAHESGFCAPEVLTQMARQVIAHDLRPGTSVSDQLRKADGEIIAPGYRVKVRVEVFRSE